MTLATLTTVVAWFVGAIVVLLAARSENHRLHVNRLEDIASMMLRFAEHEIDEIRAERPGDIIHVESASTLDPRFHYQIWTAGGELMLVSAGTAREPYAPLQKSGHSEIEIDGVEHYVYALWNDDRSMQIQVVERVDKEDHLTATVGGEMLLLFLLSVTGLVAVNRWLFGRATTALEQTAGQLLNRSPGDLAPVIADDPPRELVPLLMAINGLFVSVGRAFEAEHHFTSHAAHELRTPLAAVRIQAQVAERAHSAGGTQEALQQLGLCIDRASRMIDQLLTLARVESMPIQPRSLVVVRMDRLAAQVLEDLRPFFEQRAIRLEVELEPAAVRGLEFALSALVRNLVENALRYTPAGGVVRIESWEQSGASCIAVDDSGSGIPPDQRERVFEPFYRIAGDDVEGCGIGLSIVRSVVRVHGGRITLSDSALGGLRVAVRFDSPSAAAALRK
ncbi:MAG TPA: ATP-binding protein [Burkholderiaceae bacterium]|nr:ATP-binding protein [Burkholderiaceae bacterium]